MSQTSIKNLDLSINEPTPVNNAAYLKIVCLAEYGFTKVVFH